MESRLTKIKITGGSAETASTIGIEDAKEKSKRYFTTNQQFTSSLLSTHHQADSPLKVKLSRMGSVDDQPFQPMMKAAKQFSINLDQVPAPSINHSAGTLLDLIKRYCSEHRIEMPDDKKSSIATFTSLSTALPGQHDIADLDCSQSTQAEFAPVLCAPDATKRALVLCYPPNGDAKSIKVDLLTVHKDGHMPCIGRRSGQTTTAFKAAEVSNSFASQMEMGAPELFTELKQSGCIVVSVEYELVEFEKPPSPISKSVIPEIGEPMSKSLSLMQSLLDDSSEPTMRSTERQRTRGISLSMGTERARERSHADISTYAMIGQGTAVKDSSITVTEIGKRVLSRISVYHLSAIVVNLKGQEAGLAEVLSTETLMKKRADESAESYMKYKSYSPEAFIEEINDYTMTQYKFTCMGTPIIPHAFLQLAGLAEENPKQAEALASTTNHHELTVTFALPQATVLKCFTKLRAQFAKDDYRLQPNPSTSNYNIVFSTVRIGKYIKAIKNSIDKLFTHSRTLSAYKKYSLKEPFPLESMAHEIYSIPALKELKLTDESDAFEITLLRMFGFKKEPTIMQFGICNSYVDAMTAIGFVFNIPGDMATKLVDNINSSQLDGQARLLVYGDAKPEYTLKKGLSQIAIDVSLLKSATFLLQFAKTFAELEQERPALIDHLRFKSKAQRERKECLSTLATIGESYSKASKASPSYLFYLALSDFLVVIKNETASNEMRIMANDNLITKMGLFQKSLKPTQCELFEQGDKVKIMQIQQELRLPTPQ